MSYLKKNYTKHKSKNNSKKKKDKKSIEQDF